MSEPTADELDQRRPSFWSFKAKKQSKVVYVELYGWSFDTLDLTLHPCPYLCFYWSIKHWITVKYFFLLITDFVQYLCYRLLKYVKKRFNSLMNFTTFTNYCCWSSFPPNKINTKSHSDPLKCLRLTDWFHMVLHFTTGSKSQTWKHTLNLIGWWFLYPQPNFNTS